MGQNLAPNLPLRPNNSGHGQSKGQSEVVICSDDDEDDDTPLLLMKVNKT
jgi:hypothetical protein